MMYCFKYFVAAVGQQSATILNLFLYLNVSKEVRSFSHSKTN